MRVTEIGNIGWLVTCGVCYALGWTEGRKQGEIDGLEEAKGELV